MWVVFPFLLLHWIYSYMPLFFLSSDWKMLKRSSLLPRKNNHSTLTNDQRRKYTNLKRFITLLLWENILEFQFNKSNGRNIDSTPVLSLKSQWIITAKSYMKDENFPSQYKKNKNAFQNPKSQTMSNLIWIGISIPQSERRSLPWTESLNVLRMTRSNYIADPTITVFWSKPWALPAFCAPILGHRWYVREQTESRWVALLRAGTH